MNCFWKHFQTNFENHLSNIYPMSIICDFSTKWFFIFLKMFPKFCEMFIIFFQKLKIFPKIIFKLTLNRNLKIANTPMV